MTIDNITVEIINNVGFRKLFECTLPVIPRKGEILFHDTCSDVALYHDGHLVSQETSCKVSTDSFKVTDVYYQLSTDSHQLDRVCLYVD